MSNLRTTADQILDCTRSLVIAGGYNGFSYADIAAVVGIRKASIHHHFPAKSDLVRTLVNRYRQEAEAGLAGLDSAIASPAARLRAYAGYWEACILDDTASFCLCALLAGQMTMLPEDVALEVRTHFQTLSAWLTAVLSTGADQGEFHLSAPPAVEADGFMATVHGAMLSARAYGDPATFASIIQPTLQRLGS
ncbi:TetR/AcrR family transcriptional regulator [Agrobacterium sp. ES01]|uniref:TetR/AcrR family transcriptional regulator n=1 Tax=Agrobacterium sp. ES01 TaxID=3420714 RepID=UPI003D0A11E0